MTGEGTKTNPYLITNVQELYSMVEAGGTDVYFRLDTDIDFNETEYAENFVPIPLYCAELDGNGHTIRNIYCNTSGTAVVFSDMTSTESSNTVEVKNLTLENVELVAADITFFAADSGTTSGTINLSECIFSMRCTLTQSLVNSTTAYKGLMNGRYRKVNLYLCTVKLEFNGIKEHSLLTGCTVNRSQFYVDIRYISGNSKSYAQTSLFYKVDMTDTAVFGKVKADNTATTNVYHFAGENKHSNCYQAIEYDNVATMCWDACIISPCFYNADLASGVKTVTNEPDSGTTYAVNFLALTTEQCKDAEYLRSVGFICEGAV
ncbi:MAG: hypothetical protein E7497_01615 [Ruminococcus sp.]|nr:hypothetical protein [Ruminococcus sp.]